jgi:protein tyrosine/serine phosphatase
MNDIVVLKAFGVKTIVNLEGGLFLEGSIEKQKEQNAWCAKAGIANIYHGLSPVFAPTEEDLDTILDHARNYRFRDILFHCEKGVDRTGVASLIIETVVLGRPYKECERRMYDLGFHKMPYEAWMPEVRQYIKERTGKELT